MSWPAGCGCTGAASMAVSRRRPALPSSLTTCGPAPATLSRRRHVAELVFDCIGVRADKYAVVPTVSFALRIAETTGQKVDAIALRCQLRIEPAKRRYTAEEAARLDDLFGETARWNETLKPMQLAIVSTMVPGFTGS